MAEQRKLTSLQILRGLAAACVVLYHTVGTARAYGHPVHILSPLQGWGDCGVDVFFVISGFVMVYTQWGPRPSTPLRFFWHRWLRIAPLYWVLTLAYVALAHISKPGWVIASLFFGAHPLCHTDPVLFVGWSLEWEMLFYAVFALSLLIGNQRVRLIVACVATTVAVLALGSLSALEFVLGMLVGWLVCGSERKPAALAASLVGGAALFATIVLRPPIHIWYGLPASLLVYGLAVHRQWRTGVLSRLGDASYSLYLVQVFTIPAFYKLATKLGVVAAGDVLALGCLAGSLLVGYAVHRWLEAPMTRALRKVR
jgi:peptidoglycan/LPS O-acetylase OafA/YrhL